jgi:hypothetical protein
VLVSAVKAPFFIRRRRIKFKILIISIENGIFIGGKLLALPIMV